MLKALVGRAVDFRDDNEWVGMWWATVYGFFIMLSYYVLRAVRDEISAAERGAPSRS